jgi:hypothetical protein
MGQRQSIPLDHHIYDSMIDTWFCRNLKPQPFVNITVLALPEDYSAFGVDLSTPSPPTVIPALADTGCQSCLAGLRVIHRIGLSKSDLIPLTMHMNTDKLTMTVSRFLKPRYYDSQAKTEVEEWWKRG